MDKIIDTKSEEYRAGVDDMWERMKTLYNLPVDIMEKLFDGNSFIDDILDNFTGTEVLERLKKYYEKVAVGDVIFNDLTKTQAIVTFVDTFGQWQCVNSKGFGFILDIAEQQYWKKIGHNNEVIEALKRLEIQLDH